uniref:Uncharacterized protein n=1 Tax=Branchiostoma floridae TaxID=7739 RepID=C3XSV8_BRAFL|eukprot:XP_002613020.1 hypothetical protein BRAFLDRAFT_74805 [Branchiostoma floridae]
MHAHEVSGKLDKDKHPSILNGCKEHDDDKHTPDTTADAIDRMKIASDDVAFNAGTDENMCQNDMVTPTLSINATSRQSRKYPNPLYTIRKQKCLTKAVNQPDSGYTSKTSGCHSCTNPYETTVVTTTYNDDYGKGIICQNDIAAAIPEPVYTTPDNAEPYAVAYEVQDSSHISGCNSTEQVADQMDPVDGNTDIPTNMHIPNADPNTLTDALNRNPMYVPNIPQQARCRFTVASVGIAVMITALLTASAVFGTWYYYNGIRAVHKMGQTDDAVTTPGQFALDTTYRYIPVHHGVDGAYTNGQPVVDTAYTDGHPAVDTTYIAGHLDLDTTFTPGYHDMDAAYTNGHPVVDITYTDGHPAVDTTYTNGHPAVDTTYTDGHPAVDTAYIAGNPATYFHVVDSWTKNCILWRPRLILKAKKTPTTILPHRRLVMAQTDDATTTPGQSALDTTYMYIPVHHGVDGAYSNGQPVVDTAYTDGHPAVDTTYIADHLDVDTTFTPGHHDMDAAYTNGHPAVDTTHTDGHHAVDTTYSSGNPATYFHATVSYENLFTKQKGRFFGDSSGLIRAYNDIDADECARRCLKGYGRYDGVSPPCLSFNHRPAGSPEGGSARCYLLRSAKDTAAHPGSEWDSWPHRNYYQRKVVCKIIHLPFTFGLV